MDATETKSIAKRGAKKKSVAAKRGTKTTFGTAITQIRKDLAPNLTSSLASHVLIDRLVMSFLKRLATKSGALAKYSSRKTLKGAHTGTAGEMILVGPMAGASSEHAETAWRSFEKSVAEANNAANLKSAGGEASAVEAA